MGDDGGSNEKKGGKISTVKRENLTKRVSSAN